MNEAGYPKWVQRAPHVGPVLCLTAAEEKHMLDDWNAEQVKAAEEAKAKAEAEAKEAKEAAELVLGGGKAKGK